MRISDWSSDVCSSDLRTAGRHRRTDTAEYRPRDLDQRPDRRDRDHARSEEANIGAENRIRQRLGLARPALRQDRQQHPPAGDRSEEHTSELQSLMRTSYAAFCLIKTPITKQPIQSNEH